MTALHAVAGLVILAFCLWMISLPDREDMNR